MIPEDSPYEAIGGQDRVVELANRFYDAMERDEPELTAIHRLQEPGKIHLESRQRFALFLIGWLGGPQVYMQIHGHPRLRMRHAHVEVDIAMRDAWLRSMTAAMDEMSIDGDLRAMLDARFKHVANFLRNVPEKAAES